MASPLRPIALAVVCMLFATLTPGAARPTPALIEDTMTCPLVEVQGKPGQPTRIKIARGRVHGVERLTRGNVQAGLGATYSVIARVEVTEVGEQESWLRILPNEPGTRLEAVQPGLSVEVPVRLPATVHRGLLFRLFLLDVTFLDNYRQPLVDPLALLGPDGPAVEQAALRKMVELGYEVLEFTDGLTQVVTHGPWKGQVCKAIMTRATPEDYAAFLRFVLDYPGKYMRKSWKITETFATWIINDMPGATADVLAELEAASPPDFEAFGKTLDDNELKAVVDWVGDAINEDASRDTARAEARLALVDRLLALRVAPVPPVVAAVHAHARAHALDLYPARRLEAADAWQRAAEAYGRVPVADMREAPLEQIVCSNNMALALYNGGKVAEAERRIAATRELVVTLVAHPPDAEIAAHAGLSDAYAAHLGAQIAFDRGEYKKVIADLTPLIGRYAKVGAKGFRAREAAVRELVSKAHQKLGETDRAAALLADNEKRAEEIGDVRWQAEIRYAIGDLYYATSRYEPAITAYQKAAELARAAADSKREARALTATGQAEWSLGRRDAALARHAEAMRVREATGDDSELAWQLVQVAKIKIEAGDRAAARADLERALAIDRKRGDQRHEAEVLVELGWLAHALSDPTGAEQSFAAARTLEKTLGRASEEAWAMVGEAHARALRKDFVGAVERILGAVAIGDRIGELGLTVRARRTQAAWLREIDRREDARRVLEEALAAVGDDLGLRGDVLIDRAWQRLSDGALQAATEDAKAAVTLAERAMDATRRLNAAHVMASIHNARGEYAEGLAVLEAMAARAREVGNRPLLAVALRERGWQLASFGRLAEARKSAEEAIALAEQNNDPVARAWGLNTAAKVASAYGDARENQRLLGEAATLFRAADLTADEAVIVANQGLALLELRDFEGAVKLLDESRRLVGNKSWADLDIMIDAHRGKAFGELGRWDEADQALAAAIERARGAAFERVPGLLGLRGELLAKRGDFDRALPFLEEAVAEGDKHGKVGAAPHARLGIALERAGRTKEAEPILRESLRRAEAIGGALPWEALYRLARIEAASGREKAALKTLEAAAKQIEHGEAPLEDDTARARYWGDKAGVYTLLVRLLLGEGRADDALRYVERAKVAELQELDRDRRSDVEIELDLSEARLQSELLAERKKRAPDLDKVKRLDALLTEVQSRRSKFIEHVDRQADARSDRYTIQPLELAKLRKYLPAGMLILSPIALDEELVVFAMTRDASTHFTSRVPASEIDALVKTALAETSPTGRTQRGAAPAGALPPAPEAIAASRERMLKTMQRLYDLLVRAAIERFGAPDTLLVSPSASLRYLPFSALHDGSDWLVAKTTIVALTSLDQTKLAERAPVSFGRARVLAVADPDGSLAGARREVQEVREVFRDIDVLEGSAATIDALKARIEHPGFDIVHLATHGILNPDVDRTHLVLAGAPLFYGDIPSLRFMKTKLVVLSACDTASRGTGAEVTGLAYQFEQTDVRAIIATLWPVDDDATALLMGDFYRHLRAGLTYQEALARAQRALAAEPRYAHPYYWAPFILIGAP